LVSDVANAKHDWQVLYAFIDESYTKDRYYVCAFVVPEGQIAALDAAIKRAGVYAEGFGVAAGAEFHAHEMMSGLSDWRPVRGNPRASLAIYRHALHQLVAVPGAKMFIEGVDIPRLNARYSYPEPPHRVTLRYLLEAVDRYALKIGEQVLVIADELPDQVAHGDRAALYQTIGTGGYRSSMLTTVQMPIRFGSSAQSPGLQASDLIVYLYRRKDAHVETDQRSAAAVSALWDILHPIWGWVRRWDP
jgi:hypothetical protein